MEDLNKNQIILLTLLVSFVTSIATGIMTVSLLQQAPVEVVRNINSIVEKTIEKVTPASPLITTQNKEVTTIIVKEEDSILSTIDKNLKSLIRIIVKDPAGIESFYGIGIVTNKDGTISAHNKTVYPGSTYKGKWNDEMEMSLTLLSADENTNFLLFKANKAEKTNYTFVPATIGDIEPKLGQTVISLGGDTINAVSVGRVVSLTMKDMTVGTTTTKYLSAINTDVSAKDIVDGSPLFNLSGDLVGIDISGNESKSFVPVSLLKKELLLLSGIPKTQ